MSAVAHIWAITADYDIRASTEAELHLAIKKVALYPQCPEYRMTPLKMVNGQWRAIVRGSQQSLTAKIDIPLDDINATDQ